MYLKTHKIWAKKKGKVLFPSSNIYFEKKGKVLFMNIRLLAKLDKWEWEQLVSGIELDICMSNICKLGAEVNAECCLVSPHFPKSYLQKIIFAKNKIPTILHPYKPESF